MRAVTETWGGAWDVSGGGPTCATSAADLSARGVDGVLDAARLANAAARALEDIRPVANGDANDAENTGFGFGFDDVRGGSDASNRSDAAMAWEREERRRAATTIQSVWRGVASRRRASASAASRRVPTARPPTDPAAAAFGFGLVADRTGFGTGILSDSDPDAFLATAMAPSAEAFTAETTRFARRVLHACRVRDMADSAFARNPRDVLDDVRRRARNANPNASEADARAAADDDWSFAHEWGHASARCKRASDALWELRASAQSRLQNETSAAGSDAAVRRVSDVDEALRALGAELRDANAAVEKTPATTRTVRAFAGDALSRVSAAADAAVGFWIRETKALAAERGVEDPAEKAKRRAEEAARDARLEEDMGGGYGDGDGHRGHRGYVGGDGAVWYPPAAAGANGLVGYEQAPRGTEPNDEHSARTWVGDANGFGEGYGFGGGFDDTGGGGEFFNRGDGGGAFFGGAAADEDGWYEGALDADGFGMRADVARSGQRRRNALLSAGLLERGGDFQADAAPRATKTGARRRSRRR